jgi:lipoprotein-releasing system ATP-binding protein
MSDHSNDTVLQARGLGKVFRQGERALEILSDLDLHLQAGESVAIVGTSGVGKSTLLHLLGGLDQPTAGSVWLAGRSLNDCSERERGELRNRHLGFIYQFHHLLPEFTALENVSMPLLIRGLAPAEIVPVATDLLQQVGLGERLQHKPSELSGGERQRAAVARAMAGQPDCIIADEPTGNLDESTAARVFDVLLQLRQRQNTALLFATHDRQLAARADRVLELTQKTLRQIDIQLR